MNDELRLLIVEDDVALCSAYKSLVDTHDNMRIVNITNSSHRALTDMRVYFPQVVILDLELHAGSGSGIEFLQGLKSISLDYVPYIIIVTNNTSSTTVEFARQLGADFIFCKYEEDFSVNKVIDFIDTMQSVVFSKKKLAPSAPELTPELRENEQRTYLSRELNSIGITPKLKGYKYLIDSIIMVASNQDCNFRSLIAEAYHKSQSSIERAMQNAIQHAWTCADINELSAHYTARFSPGKNCPTLGEFVFYYADKISSM